MVRYDEVKSELRDSMNEPIPKTEMEPTTAARVYAMKAVERNQWYNYHNWAMMVENLDLKDLFVSISRDEHRHVTMNGTLLDADWTPLERAVILEMGAVLTMSDFAQEEDNPEVCDVINYLLTDHAEHGLLIGDHMERLEGRRVDEITKGEIEFREGRPIEDQHLEVSDLIKNYVKCTEADPMTNVHIQNLIATEKAMWSFLTSTAIRVTDDQLKELCLELGMIENQHVAMLESLLDPCYTPLQSAVTYEFTEITSYRRFMDEEPDETVRAVFEDIMNEDRSHLRATGRMLKKFEGIDPTEFTTTKRAGIRAELTPNDYLDEIVPREINVVSRGTEFVQE